MATNAVINVSSSGDSTIIAAPGDGKFLQIFGYVFVESAATAVTFKAGSDAITGPMSAGANGGVSAFSGTNDPLFNLPNNTAFVLNSSAAVQVSGHVQYAVRSFK